MEPNLLHDRSNGRDAHALYRASLAAHPVLSAAQERLITTRIATARHALSLQLADHPPAVLRLVADYRTRRARGARLDDLLVDPPDPLPPTHGCDPLDRLADLCSRGWPPATERHACFQAITIHIDYLRRQGIAMVRETHGTGEPGGERRRRAVAALAELHAAQNHLIAANQRLVLAVARRYRDHGLALMDLVQEGNLGLMRAADRFDHRRGTKFSTYAVWWIRRAMAQACFGRHSVVSIPFHRARALAQVRGAHTRLEAQLGRRPTTTETARWLGWAETDVTGALATARHVYSLDGGLQDEDASLADRIEDPTAPDPVAAVNHSQLRGMVAQALATLPSRQAQIMRLRFGIGVPRRYTLEAIAGQMGLTRERIRQLEKQALEHLRGLPTALRDFLPGDAEYPDAPPG